MRYLTFLALAAVVFLSTSSTFQNNQILCNGIIPENDMWIGVDSKLASKEMTKEIFDNVIDRIEEVYTPIIEDMNLKFEVVRKWDDGTVNAYARRVGRTMEVNMFGGLARHPSITPDGFALVVCHETGHHLGGAPKKGSLFGTWASNEGQSDYWGVTKCMKKVFENDDNIQIISSMTIPATITSNCNELFNNVNESALCQRVAMAGNSLGNFFNVASQGATVVHVDTPDTRVVNRTDDNHPKAQCRLDTYFQASLCDISHNSDVSNSDANVGVCTRKAGYTKGIRPLCWYKP